MDSDVAIFFGIIVYALVVAWLSRHVALDMDRRGTAGWPYGMMTFFIPPLGLALWLLDRDRPPTGRQWRPHGAVADLIFFVLLLVTFPWGLVAWLFLNRRASPEG